jgi:membrane protein DedA with SNARE-associated domain
MPNVFVSAKGDGRILPTGPGRHSSLFKLLLSGVAGALVGQTVAAVLGKQLSDQIIAREDMLGRLQSRLLEKRRELLDGA